jgi:hypothetical protein
VTNYALTGSALTKERRLPLGSLLILTGYRPATEFPCYPLQSNGNRKTDYRAYTGQQCSLHYILGVNIRKDGKESTAGRPGHSTRVIARSRHHSYG